MADEIQESTSVQQEEPPKEAHEGTQRAESGGERPVRKRHNGEDYNTREKSSESGRYPRFKKKGCRFCRDAEMVNYKKVDILERFITDGGKILPRRVTGTCAKHQRIVAREIKRARLIALLPFIEK